MGPQYNDSVFCSLFLVMCHGVLRQRDEFLSEVQKGAEYELSICFLPKQFCAISLVNLVLIEHVVPQIQTSGFYSCHWNLQNM